MRLSSQRQVAGAKPENNFRYIWFQRLSGFMECLDFAAGLSAEFQCTKETGEDKTESIKYAYR